LAHDTDLDTHRHRVERVVPPLGGMATTAEVLTTIGATR
jgi:hypothetical protein